MEYVVTKLLLAGIPLDGSPKALTPPPSKSSDHSPWKLLSTNIENDDKTHGKLVLVWVKD